jgi:hypothetical protein
MILCPLSEIQQAPSQALAGVVAIDAWNESNGVNNHLVLQELAVLVPEDQLLDDTRSRDIVVFETKAVTDRLFPYP